MRFGDRVVVTNEESSIVEAGTVGVITHVGDDFVRVLFEGHREGNAFERWELTTDLKWVPPREWAAIEAVSQIHRQEFNSQRPKRDRVARQVYDAIFEHLTVHDVTREIDKRKREILDHLDGNADKACEIMHDAYEAAAAEAGLETQEASRVEWAEVPEANKAAMRAGLYAVLDSIVIRANY